MYALEAVIVSLVQGKVLSVSYFFVCLFLSVLCCQRLKLNREDGENRSRQTTSVITTAAQRTCAV